MYYIVGTYEDRYLKADNTITTTKEQAIKFKTAGDAQNLIDHRLPKLIRNCLGDVHIIDDGQINERRLNLPDNDKENFKVSLSSKELVKEVLSFIISDVKTENLKEKLSTTDKMLSDIYHYRENIGRSSDGLDELERNVLIKRRKIKNEIKCVTLLNKVLKDNELINIKELISEYNFINCDEFKPRVLKSLFGENEIIPKFEDVWSED